MFKDFLIRKTRNTLKIKDGEGIMAYMKGEYSDDITFIYNCRSYHDDNLKIDEKLALFGIYNHCSNIFYYTEDYNRNYHVLEDETVTYSTLVNLRTEIEEKVKAKLVNIVENSLPNYELSNDDMLKISALAKENAKSHYILGTKIDDTCYKQYYDTKAFNTSDIISAITDIEEFTDNEANMCINKKISNIHYAIKLNKETEKEIQKLQKDRTYEELKKIIEAVSGDYKTIRIEIFKNEKFFEFKTLNNLKRYYNSSYLSTLDIQAQDRRKFETLFGRHKDYNFEDIIKISYGKKVLYERQSLQK